MQMSPVVATVDSIFIDNSTVPEVIPHQAEACESAEAEPSHPSVDSPEDQQHHQVRLAAISYTFRRYREIATRTRSDIENLRLTLHPQVQRQATTLAQDPSRYLSVSPPRTIPLSILDFYPHHTPHTTSLLYEPAATMGIAHMAGIERSGF
jgi:hypothetical protein